MTLSVAFILEKLHVGLYVSLEPGKTWS